MADPLPLGDFLPKIIKQAKPSKKALEGRRLAQKVFGENYPQFQTHASVRSVKTGVITIETDSSALFQELEGFHKDKLLELFRAAGMQAHTVRVQLAKSTSGA
jgi:hypothetical protein